MLTQGMFTSLHNFCLYVRNQKIVENLFTGAFVGSKYVITVFSVATLAISLTDTCHPGKEGTFWLPDEIWHRMFHNKYLKSKLPLASSLKTW